MFDNIEYNLDEEDENAGYSHDIEEVARVAPDKIVRTHIDPLLGLRDYQARDIAADIDSRRTGDSPERADPGQGFPEVDDRPGQERVDPAPEQDPDLSGLPPVLRPVGE